MASAAEQLASNLNWGAIGKATELKNRLWFTIGALVNKTHAFSTFKNSWWIPVWLGGVLVIGYFGRYGTSNRNDLPAFWDLGVVIVWSLAVYYVALAMRLEPNGVSEEVAKDAHQLADLDDLATA